MYILADFAQENKEQKKQPNYLVPALVAGGLGLGALAALRMGSKKSLEAVKKETQQQLEDFKRRFPSVSNKDFEDYAKEMRKKSQGKGATGYLGLTPEEKRVKIANRRALLKEVGNKNEPYGDVRPLPPDPETGVYYLLGKKTAYSSSGLPLSESMRKGINRSISNSNKRNALRAQDLAESRGIKYKYREISDFGYKPITAKVGSPKFERIVESLSKAQNKLMAKADNLELHGKLKKQAKIRGFLPIETSPDELKFIGQKTRFDNMRPVDLDTTKSRKFLPYTPKEDGFVDSMSPVTSAFKPNKDDLDRAKKQIDIHKKIHKLRSIQDDLIEKPKSQEERHRLLKKVIAARNY